MRFLLLFLFFITAVADTNAQPFREEIRAFKKSDSLNMPPRKANLFVGSSSLRMWKNMEQDFSGYLVINRGFGGATLPDVIRYAGDIIFPYHPKQVLIYCGDNDLAESDTVRAETVLQRFTRLFTLIRNNNPHQRIVFISIKPSPSRQHLMPEIQKANEMIRGFLKNHRRTKYVDVYTPMLTASGVPRPELFLADKLHMNEEGYRIWQKAIRPVLKK